MMFRAKAERTGWSVETCGLLGCCCRASVRLGDRARAARDLAIVLGGADGVGDLQESRQRRRRRHSGGLCAVDSELNVLGSTRAAHLLSLVLDSAGRLLALQLALGAWAGRRLGARPRALGLLAQRRAVGLRGYAGGVALGGRTHGLALGAVFLLAHVLRAAHAALGLLAVNRAFGAFRLLALHFTLGASTDRVADGRAGWVIALPTALRVALVGSGADSGGGGGGRQSGLTEHAHKRDNEQ